MESAHTQKKEVVFFASFFFFFFGRVFCWKVRFCSVGSNPVMISVQGMEGVFVPGFLAGNLASLARERESLSARSILSTVEMGKSNL